jgi:hypothetical protein
MNYFLGRKESLSRDKTFHSNFRSRSVEPETLVLPSVGRKQRSSTEKPDAYESLNALRTSQDSMHKCTKKQASTHRRTKDQSPSTTSRERWTSRHSRTGSHCWSFSSPLAPTCSMMIRSENPSCLSIPWSQISSETTW